VEAFAFDLLLLDVMLPKLNGIKLCQQLRRIGNRIPILLLTALDNSTDKVMGWTREQMIMQHLICKS